jgi:hypothetical protein
MVEKQLVNLLEEGVDWVEALNDHHPLQGFREEHAVYIAHTNA